MKLKYKILIHLAFWVYMFNQTLFTIVIMAAESYDHFGEMTVYPLTSLLTFYTLYLCFGLFFKMKHKLIPSLILLGCSALLIPMRIGIEYLFWNTLGEGHDMAKSYLTLHPVIWFHSIRLVLIYGIYALLIQLAIRWFENQKLKSDLLIQTKASELALLRSQINPHFLFNTLNNIYSLVYKKSDEAPEALMKMSSIMRYMLYESKSDHILLDKEIEYLQGFIELEKLRLHQKDFVEMTIAGTIEGRSIAPMMLIPFVENAFKHGNKNCPPPGIKINFFIDPQWMQFEISNCVRKNSDAHLDPVSGIGIQNIRRRLEILYPSKHKLEISRTDDLFTVLLIIYV
jgi:two-component system, LytTR family, sensor kinase